jgi:NadR type nicotinamide-nucleotide adenylyltransferase
VAKGACKSNMLTEDNLYRIVITGPESTGKTQLAQALAQKLNATWIPEYAREYVEHLDRPYTYNDVIQIASYQIAQERAYDAKIAKGILIFDTWLIITKVWLDLVFGKCPDWICDHIRSSKIDLFLVCDTDLPWIADPVRENGGEKRNELFQIYCNEISTFGFKYEIVSGFGDFRTRHAMISLSKHGLKL